MKKALSLILALALCLSLCACGNGSGNAGDKAFELSKTAFEDTHKAYEKLQNIGHDILAAWQLGLNEESKLRSWGKGFDLLCEHVSLSRDDMLDGLAIFEYQASDKLLMQDYYTESVRDFYNLYFYAPSSSDSEARGLLSLYDNVFSACIALVMEAYIQNGELAEIEALLSSAQENVKQLSKHHSDYEHYEFVKQYFTAANAYFNFCSEPSGTLDQAAQNISSYESTASQCYNSLYYFFE